MSSSLGDFSTAYGANNKRPGIYTKQGNEILYNGDVISKPAMLTTGKNAWLVSINKQSPVTYCYSVNNVKDWQSRKSIENGMIGKFPYPENVTQFCQGSFYLPPGTHMIEVIFLKKTEKGWSFSTDSMVWEQRFLFEGFNYIVNAEELPNNRLRFAITLDDKR